MSLPFNPQEINRVLTTPPENSRLTIDSLNRSIRGEVVESGRTNQYESVLKEFQAPQSRDILRSSSVLGDILNDGGYLDEQPPTLAASSVHNRQSVLGIPTETDVTIGGSRLKQKDIKLVESSLYQRRSHEEGLVDSVRPYSHYNPNQQQQHQSTNGRQKVTFDFNSSGTTPVPISHQKPPLMQSSRRGAGLLSHLKNPITRRYDYRRSQSQYDELNEQHGQYQQQQHEDDQNEDNMSESNRFDNYYGSSSVQENNGGNMHDGQFDQELPTATNVTQTGTWDSNWTGLSKALRGETASMTGTVTSYRGKDLAMIPVDLTLPPAVQTTQRRDQKHKNLQRLLDAWELKVESTFFKKWKMYVFKRRTKHMEREANKIKAQRFYELITYSRSFFIWRMKTSAAVKANVERQAIIATSQLKQMWNRFIEGILLSKQESKHKSIARGYYQLQARRKFLLAWRISTVELRPVPMTNFLQIRACFKMIAICTEKEAFEYTSYRFVIEKAGNSVNLSSPTRKMRSSRNSRLSNSNNPLTPSRSNSVMALSVASTHSPQQPTSPWKLPRSENETICSLERLRDYVLRWRARRVKSRLNLLRLSTAVLDKEMGRRIIRSWKAYTQSLLDMRAEFLRKRCLVFFKAWFQLARETKEHRRKADIIAKVSTKKRLHELYIRWKQNAKKKHRENILVSILERKVKERELLARFEAWKTMCKAMNIRNRMIVNQAVDCLEIWRQRTNRRRDMSMLQEQCENRLVYLRKRSMMNHWKHMRVMFQKGRKLFERNAKNRGLRQWLRRLEENRTHERKTVKLANLLEHNQKARLFGIWLRAWNCNFVARNAAVMHEKSTVKSMFNAWRVTTSQRKQGVLAIKITREKECLEECFKEWRCVANIQIVGGRARSLMDDAFSKYLAWGFLERWRNFAEVRRARKEELMKCDEISRNKSMTRAFSALSKNSQYYSNCKRAEEVITIGLTSANLQHSFNLWKQTFEKIQEHKVILKYFSEKRNEASKQSVFASWLQAVETSKEVENQRVLLASRNLKKVRARLCLKKWHLRAKRVGDLKRIENEVSTQANKNVPLLRFAFSKWQNAFNARIDEHEQVLYLRKTFNDKLMKSAFKNWTLYVRSLIKKRFLKTQSTDLSKVFTGRRALSRWFHNAQRFKDHRIKREKAERFYNEGSLIKSFGILKSYTDTRIHKNELVIQANTRSREIALRKAFFAITGEAHRRAIFRQLHLNLSSQRMRLGMEHWRSFTEDKRIKCEGIEKTMQKLEISWWTIVRNRWFLNLKKESIKSKKNRMATSLFVSTTTSKAMSCLRQYTRTKASLNHSFAAVQSKNKQRTLRATFAFMVRYSKENRKQRYEEMVCDKHYRKLVQKRTMNFWIAHLKQRNAIRVFMKSKQRDFDSSAIRLVFDKWFVMSHDSKSNRLALEHREHSLVSKTFGRLVDFTQKKRSLKSNELAFVSTRTLRKMTSHFTIWKEKKDKSLKIKSAMVQFAQKKRQRGLELGLRKWGEFLASREMTAQQNLLAHRVYTERTLVPILHKWSTWTIFKQEARERGTILASQHEGRMKMGVLRVWWEWLETRKENRKRFKLAQKEFMKLRVQHAFNKWQKRSYYNEKLRRIVTNVCNSAVVNHCFYAWKAYKENQQEKAFELQESCGAINRHRDLSYGLRSWMSFAFERKRQRHLHHDSIAFNRKRILSNNFKQWRKKTFSSLRIQHLEKSLVNSHEMRVKHGVFREWTKCVQIRKLEVANHDNAETALKRWKLQKAFGHWHLSSIRVSGIRLISSSIERKMLVGTTMKHWKEHLEIMRKKNSLKKSEELFLEKTQMRSVRRAIGILHEFAIEKRNENEKVEDFIENNLKKKTLLAWNSVAKHNSHIRKLSKDASEKQFKTRVSTLLSRWRAYRLHSKKYAKNLQTANSMYRAKLLKQQFEMWKSRYDRESWIREGSEKLEGKRNIRSMAETFSAWRTFKDDSKQIKSKLEDFQGWLETRKMEQFLRLWRFNADFSAKERVLIQKIDRRTGDEARLRTFVAWKQYTSFRRTRRLEKQHIDEQYNQKLLNRSMYSWSWLYRSTTQAQKAVAHLENVEKWIRLRRLVGVLRANVEQQDWIRYNVEKMSERSMRIRHVANRCLGRLKLFSASKLDERMKIKNFSNELTERKRKQSLEGWRMLLVVKQKRRITLLRSMFKKFHVQVVTNISLRNREYYLEEKIIKQRQLRLLNHWRMATDAHKADRFRKDMNSQSNAEAIKNIFTSWHSFASKSAKCRFAHDSIKAVIDTRTMRACVDGWVETHNLSVQTREATERLEALRSFFALCRWKQWSSMKHKHNEAERTIKTWQLWKVMNHWMSVHKSKKFESQMFEEATNQLNYLRLRRFMNKFKSAYSTVITNRSNEEKAIEFHKMTVKRHTISAWRVQMMKTRRREILSNVLMKISNRHTLSQSFHVLRSEVVLNRASISLQQARQDNIVCVFFDALRKRVNKSKKKALKRSKLDKSQKKKKSKKKKTNKDNSVTSPPLHPTSGLSASGFETKNGRSLLTSDLSTDGQDLSLQRTRIFSPTKSSTSTNIGLPNNSRNLGSSHVTFSESGLKGSQHYREQQQHQHHEQQQYDHPSDLQFTTPLGSSISANHPSFISSHQSIDNEEQPFRQSQISGVDSHYGSTIQQQQEQQQQQQEYMLPSSPAFHSSSLAPSSPLHSSSMEFSSSLARSAAATSNRYRRHRLSFANASNFSNLGSFQKSIVDFGRVSQLAKSRVSFSQQKQQQQHQQRHYNSRHGNQGEIHSNLKNRSVAISLQVQDFQRGKYRAILSKCLQSWRQEARKTSLEHDNAVEATSHYRKRLLRTSFLAWKRNACIFTSNDLYRK